MNGLMECPIAPPGDWGSQKPPDGVPVDVGHPRLQGLVGFLALNEGSGTAANDVTRQQKPVGMYPTSSPPRWQNGGLSFDGSSNQYLNLSGSGWPMPTTPCAVTARFMPTLLNDTIRCVAGGYGMGSSTTKGGIALTSYTNGLFYADVYSSSSRYSITFAQSLAPTMRFSTVTLWWDGAIFSVVVNGKVVGTVSAAMAAIDWGSYGFRIGLRADGQRSFAGCVEFIAVHVGPLSLTDIQAFHSEPYSMFAAAQSSTFDVSNRRRRLLCGAA